MRSLGSGTAGFGQLGHQAWVYVVLRLLQPNERRWLWVVQLGQISEQLQGTLRSEPIEYWTLERTIDYLQQGPLMRITFYIDLFEQRYPPAQSPGNGREALGVGFF